MSAADWPEFADDLRWLDALIAAEIPRLRARYQLSLDEFRGLYVSDERVDQIVRGTTMSADSHAEDPEILTSNESPLSSISRILGLDAIERALVLMALAPELDLKYEILYAYLNDDVARRWPTLDLAERLLPAACGRKAIRQALMPDARLGHLHVLRQVAPPESRPWCLHTGFSLTEPMSVALLGLDGVCPTLATVATRRMPAVRWEEVPVSQELLGALRRIPALIAGDSTHPLFAFAGARGDGRAVAVEAIASDLQLPLVTCNLSSTAHADVGAPLALDIRLRPAAFLIADPGDVERSSRELRTLLEKVWATASPVFLLVEPEIAWRRITAGMPVVTVQFDDSTADRERLWHRALAECGFRVHAQDVAALAERFHLPARDIEVAAKTAAHVAALDGAADAVSHVSSVAKRLVANHFGPLGSKIEAKCGWSDIVLPEPTLVRLRDLAAAITWRRRVFDEWGFASTSIASPGVTALFAGASGTGKTMAAAVIANELGFDLYRVDLSSVVSKYIGETEKNLDRIFRAARAGHVMLFFDEADALFGRRSEVNDAHDRYANIEVAYLLQRLEDHDGVVILATNLRRNVDEAFARRMQFVIDFQPPDRSHRERLWRAVFPPGAPLAPDVDWAFLAQQFMLAGGDIRNVAVDAAFLAAESGGPITMKEIVRALARQVTKQGRMPSGSEFSAYFPLVSEGP